MVFATIAFAQQLTFDTNQVTCDASTEATATLSCKDNTDDIAVFFESKLAGLNKCRVDIPANKDTSDAIKLIGLLSDKSDGSLQDSLKTKICSRKNGEIKSEIELEITTNYNKPQQLCMSTGDPHIHTWDSKEFDNMAVGPTWLVKSDLFSVQTKQEKCYDTKSCNTAVAVRYADNVYVADLANPIFKCHSQNGCKEDLANIQSSADGGAILDLPGNIQVSTNNMNGVGINVIVKAPGQTDFAPSNCNPETDYSGQTLTDAIYPVSDSESYFDNPVLLPRSSDFPDGYTECRLPVSCNTVFPTSTEPLNAQHTQANDAPLPTNAYDGKKVPTGYKKQPIEAYQKPPPNLQLVPKYAQNATKKPSDDEIKSKCTDACPIDAFKAVGKESDADYYIKGCIDDYVALMSNGFSLAVENTRKACAQQAAYKLQDTMKT
eukprot:NODE_369_length_8668_cov_1.088575.p3 type:complete len:434 gc:universal NODE_369_length_8668_cov_1.088575:6453-7754(+)